MSGDQLDLDAIERRTRAATPGPWSAADEHGLLGPDADPAWCISRMRPGYEAMTPTEGYDYDIAEIVYLHGPMEADAEFIAHAREDVPALVAEVRRLRAARREAIADAFEEYAAAIRANPSSDAQTALDVADDIPEWIRTFVKP